MNCYLCGNSPAESPLILKDTFTGFSLARCPASDRLCSRCDYALNLRAWYWNPTKSAWVILYARNWSWLQSQGESFPCIGEIRHDPKGSFPVVSALPTRIQIRQWLIDPPEPPFTICIAESGQKHTYPWAQAAQSREYFPVQFELDTLFLERKTFREILSDFEDLLALGFTKTEILAREFKSEPLSRNLQAWFRLQDRLELHHGTRLFELAGYIAQRPTIEPPSTVPQPKEKPKCPESTDSTNARTKPMQLSLF